MTAAWTCRRLAPRLVDAVGDGAGDAEVAGHLSTCAQCRAAATALAELPAALRAETARVDAAFWDRQRAAILARLDPTEILPPRRIGWRAVAGLALAASVMGGILLRPRPSAGPPLDPPAAAALADALGGETSIMLAGATPPRLDELSDAELLALRGLVGGT